MTTIDITVGQLLNSERPLARLARQEFPVATAYKIGRVLKVVEKELEEIVKWQAQLAEKYGQRNEQGDLVRENDNRVPIREEERENFEKEMADFLQTVCSLTVNRIELRLLEDLRLTPQELMAIEPFLTE